MPEGSEQKPNTLLVAGLTPYFLEKPALWWEDNEEEITKKRGQNPAWTKNTLVAEQGQKMKPAVFLRSLSELGYEKVFGAIYPGTFKSLGSTIVLYPINKEGPYALEFLGNTLETIEEHRGIEKEKTYFKSTGKNQETNLAPGDYAVHIDHGIGIFRGVVLENGRDYYKIEYARPRPDAEPDALLVPTDEKKRIEPYYGLERPRLSRLGTPLWSKLKKKSKEEILAFAEELAKLYKTRLKQKREPYNEDGAEKEIWGDFKYELTQSQENALAEILGDMSKDEPMERLLSGDVGFGKTEIALRAALRAILNGRQAAVLAPTTVLADQHFKIFKERLKKIPANISVFSRLESKKSGKKNLEDLAEGRIDVAIGTHRLFSKDVKFKNLGLLIIDEEQRFGVRHKEHFKKLYPASDILSLSATPIPRTLAFFLAGVRPASQIEEAPHGRKAPLSKVLPFSKKLVKEALKYEQSRGGQTYYVSGRIRTIPETMEMLKKLSPRSKVASMHGRMAEKEIIRTMDKFRQKEIDVLVSTTIIENGLDISSANTMIIENSAYLGLAQAHQLRGRIGRGDEQAFAYFLYRPSSLKPDAEKRLSSLLELQGLGGGIEIAKRDLEMRGAGNILGREQSGIVNRIGWNLYFQFMNEAVEELT
ncbi:MAG: DEAD/DEAH box helicase [Candidatus Niyogibacteria bacterium]|nr:DEAD/DEAH box helicase [Candidatus Niyogibacteria bacterium]